MTQTLHCQAGNHKWEREPKRGRKPINCPKHTGLTSTEDGTPIRKTPSTSNVDTTIQRVLGEQHQRASFSCSCEFPPEMTWEQLVAMGAGCTGPQFVCSTLDTIRRAVDKLR